MDDSFLFSSTTLLDVIHTRTDSTGLYKSNIIIGKGFKGQL